MQLDPKHRVARAMCPVLFAAGNPCMGSLVCAVRPMELRRAAARTQLSGYPPACGEALIGDVGGYGTTLAVLMHAGYAARALPGR